MGVMGVGVVVLGVGVGVVVVGVVVVGVVGVWRRLVGWAICRCGWECVADPPLVGCDTWRARPPPRWSEPLRGSC